MSTLNPNPNPSFAAVLCPTDPYQDLLQWHYLFSICLVEIRCHLLLLLVQVINRRHGYGVGMVYGALPPESRRSQATLFNTPGSGVDVLVASDAVGMGLNLNIKRVVFATLKKFDGEGMRELRPAEVKQIAGRAGRYSSDHPEGYVGCLDEGDVRGLQRSLVTPNALITEACLLPR